MRFRELSPLLLLGFLVVTVALLQPRFFDSTSLNGLLLWVPMLLVVGIGQLMVVVTRGIDVSVGSMLGLTAMAVGMTFRALPALPVVAVMAIGVAAGLALGSVNGALIAWARVPPIIATLGSLSAYRGLTFILSGGEQIDSNDLPVGLTRLAMAGPIAVGGVVFSWLLVVSLAIAIAGAWLLNRTRPGRDVYAAGSNPEAALLRGVPVGRTLFIVYAATGALCGLAGSMYAARFGFVNPTAGQGFELTVIAAVAIGGTRMTGGVGSVLGVFFGCLLLASVNVALSVLGVDASWQMLVYGAIILLALAIDTATRRFVEARQG